MSLTFDEPEPIIVDESYPVNQPLSDEQSSEILDRKIQITMRWGMPIIVITLIPRRPITSTALLATGKGIHLQQSESPIEV